MGFSVARFSGGTYSPKSFRDHQLPLVNMMLLISLIMVMTMIMLMNQMMMKERDMFTQNIVTEVLFRI